MSKKTKPKQVANILELDQVSSTNAQFAVLNKRFDNLEKRSMSGAQALKNCKNCIAKHTMTKCLCEEPKSTEHVAYMGNFNRMNNPYSNTYNLGWRNCHNFSWNNNQRESFWRQPFITPQSKQNLEKNSTSIHKRNKRI